MFNHTLQGETVPRRDRLALRTYTEEIRAAYRRALTPRHRARAHWCEIFRYPGAMFSVEIHAAGSARRPLDNAVLLHP